MHRDGCQRAQQWHVNCARPYAYRGMCGDLSVLYTALHSTNGGAIWSACIGVPHCDNQCTRVTHIPRTVSALHRRRYLSCIVLNFLVYCMQCAQQWYTNAQQYFYASTAHETQRPFPCVARRESGDSALLRMAAAISVGLRQH